jgi:hypothetical protein
MIVRAFQPDDLRQIRLQPAQAWMRSTIQAPGYLEGVMRSDACTALDARGVLAIGALFTVWPGRLELCALLSALVGPSQMVALHRCARRLLAGARGRVEVTVDGEPSARRIVGCACSGSRSRRRPA